MRRQHTLINRLASGLKYGVLAGAVLAALALGMFGSSQPEKAQAEPIRAVALNEALCTTLGVAFGGIPALTSNNACQGMMEQTQFQTYAACLLKLTTFDPVTRERTLICPNNPNPNEIFVRPEPDLLNGLDLDKNQIFWSQTMNIVAYVSDDFPVRFITEKGQWLSTTGTEVGKDVFCEPGSAAYPGLTLDPDCDGDSTTVGDGVVVARLHINESDGTSGTFMVNAIQEGVAFPIEITLTGPPEKIVLTPLFGKGTIQTGATDCEFAATADAVLGAVAKAEQTIIVAKALDADDVEVVGALLTWHRANTFPQNPPFPAGDATFTLPVNRFGTGGVALPQTPTLDTGALGVGFPQFVCGGTDTGTIDLRVRFDIFTGAAADPDEHEGIEINVIGPATDMTLTAEPAAIDCNGTNTSKVTAKLTNAAGDPVANGLDVNFEVLALGTVSPMVADATDGTASATVQPLSGANNAVGDAGPRGVTVTVRAKGAIHRQTNEEDERTWDMVERSILVQCTGGPPPPGEGGGGGGTGPGGGGGGGVIRPPDTGSGPQAADGLSLWVLAGLGMAALALTGAAAATRRR